MVVFYRVLDLSSINAYVLYNQHQPKDTERGDFPKKLERCRVVPQMKRCFINTKLHKELRMTLTRVLGPDMPSNESEVEAVGPGSRKTCRLCPLKLQRMTHILVLVAIVPFVCSVQSNFVTIANNYLMFN